MEENNEINQENNGEIKPSKNKPYDFGKGFGIGIILLVIVVSNFSYLLRLSPFIIIYLSLIIYLFYKGRAKFALGLITAILIPFIILGGCLLSLGDLRGI